MDHCGLVVTSLNDTERASRYRPKITQGNLLEALRRVKSNEGSAGIDGMTVGQLSGYLKEHWLTIRDAICNAERVMRQIDARWPSNSVPGKS